MVAFMITLILFSFAFMMACPNVFILFPWTSSNRFGISVVFSCVTIFLITLVLAPESTRNTNEESPISNLTPCKPLCLFIALMCSLL
uniref:Putative product n=1 Tax=Xenopsylla cheopis TaxID=163159 RepID=A0A6M2DX07_XENCH